MLRCCWRALTDHPCTDPAEFVTDGEGLCEAHAMHKHWLRSDALRRQWDADMAYWKFRDDMWKQQVAAMKAQDEADAAARAALPWWVRTWHAFLDRF